MIENHRITTVENIHKSLTNMPALSESIQAMLNFSGARIKLLFYLIV